MINRATIVVIAGMSLMIAKNSPRILSQNNYNKKEIVEVFDAHKNIDIENINIEKHDSIINLDINQIFEELWEKKWLDLVREHMLIEINKFRSENNLNNFSDNYILDRTAQIYAEYCIDNNRLKHNDKNANTPTYRSKKNGYKTQVKENLFRWDNPSIKDIIEMWTIYSKSHEKTILEWKELIWIWVSKNNSWKVYMVLLVD